MKNNVLYGAIGLAIVGAIVYGTGALAFQGRMGQYGSNYSPERHQAMMQSFENNDYAAWKVQMAGRGAASVVTEENFARFAEMHNLMLAGKADEANKIRQELGMGNGQGRGMMGGRGQNRGGHFIDKNGDGICDMRQ